MSNDANKLKNRQEIRKYLVFAGMFLLFIGCMWWIFAPSEEDRQEKEKNAGFNTELPDPRGAGIEADKITAYEQADMRRREEEKMRTLEDFSAMADEPEPPAVEIESAPECPSGGTSGRNVGSYRRSDTFSSSHSAYNDINATLGSFYETPEEDPEKEALKAEVEQLRQAAAMQQPAQMTYEEQVALLEKSYELAARYTPGNTGTESREDAESVPTAGKRKPFPWGRYPCRWYRRFRNPSATLCCLRGLGRTETQDSIPPWAKPETDMQGTPSEPACMATRPSSAAKV